MAVPPHKKNFPVLELVLQIKPGPVLGGLTSSHTPDTLSPPRLVSGWPVY
jgi:hypothetical protein